MATCDLKLGVVGLGALGRPMAVNLINAGFSTRLHNRSRAAETGNEGSGGGSETEMWLVPSTPVRTLTSHIAVRLGPRRLVYVPGLARAGQEHRSKRCATWACRRASTKACALVQRALPTC